jgi:pimeloyl-ACP methyl ester carboxylesterase
MSRYERPIPAAPTSPDFINMRSDFDRLLAPVDRRLISRRRFLGVGLLFAAGYAIGIPPVGESVRDASVDVLQTDETARLLQVRDEAEGLLGDKVTNAFARTVLDLKSNIYKTNPQTGERKVVLGRPNASRNYARDNRFGTEALKDPRRKNPLNVIDERAYIPDSNKWIDLSEKELSPAREIIFSETLLSELEDHRLINVEGQRINTIAANRDKISENAEAYVLFPLFGNKVSKAESNLRAGMLAHRMPENPVFSFDPPAQGDSDIFTDEQVAALEKGDFTKVVEPMLKILQKQGIKKAHFVGLSLGAQLSLAAAGIADKFGLEVKSAGAYSIPVRDPNDLAVNHERGVPEMLLADFIGDEGARLSIQDTAELSMIKLYTTHPFYDLFVKASGIDNSDTHRTVDDMKRLVELLAADPRFLYAQALAENTPKSVSDLALGYLNNNPNGKVYFRSGSIDTVSRKAPLGETVDLIRKQTDAQIWLQLDPGQGHLANVHPLILAESVVFNTKVN